ncbi:MAG: hypothetical protein C0480_01105 [Bradyrhizobium sp.]|nr:hypothetical protein [Bradyrhizobium sp.]
MITQAAAALARATTSAEVLDAAHQAIVAYDAAKIAARFAKVKQAHADIIAVCHKAMADALEIEAQAQCRIADEYDIAQTSGEAAKPGEYDRGNISSENISKATVGDIGLTSKLVHEARKVRDAEKKEPGIVRKTLRERLSKGDAPTRADIKRAVEPRRVIEPTRIVPAAPTTFEPRATPAPPPEADDDYEETDYSHTCMFCCEDKETVIDATEITEHHADFYGDDVTLPRICDECVRKCVQIIRPSWGAR